MRECDKTSLPFMTCNAETEQHQVNPATPVDAGEAMP